MAGYGMVRLKNVESLFSFCEVRLGPVRCGVARFGEVRLKNNESLFSFVGCGKVRPG